MSNLNLKTVLQQIKSDKITERKEGLAAIRNVFAQDKVVAKFHINNEGHSEPRLWLVVFQAIFHAVLNEKLAFTKSTKTSAAEKRLGEAAAVVRWLVEKTVVYMNKKVVKSVLEHLLQTMVHRGELLEPVVVDYVKALKYLVCFTPHLEHIDEETWIRLVETSFNVVLEDPVRAKFEDDDDDVEDGDNECLHSDNNTDVDGSTVTQSKKRRRCADRATPQPSSSQPKPLPQTRGIRARQAQVSTEQIEFMSLLSILLSSPSAPVLSSNYPGLGKSILRRLLRFLDVYPVDGSLHYDFILTLSYTLSQLSLNMKQDIESFALGSWEKLISLWGTKNRQVKEGLVVVLRILFPFITASPDNRWGRGVGKLWQLLDGEAESKWGADRLSFDSLRLQLVSDEVDEKGDYLDAFVARTFRAGYGFDAGQALAWSVLELHADCAEKLFQLSEFAPRSDSKRSKPENPITSLLATIQKQASLSIRVYHLQILLFFIDRHWTVLHDALQQEVINSLLQFVSFDDGAIQSWAFLCFAAIAYANSNVSPHQGELSKRQLAYNESVSPFLPNMPRDRDPILWDPIWTHAIRRVNVPFVCRAACHAAYALLMCSYNYHRVSFNPNSGHSLKVMLTPQRVLTEIEALAKDLDVQGPSEPFDSVCAFLAQCLKVASQDVRLYRMQLEEKVLTWLMDNWRFGSVIGGTGSSQRKSRVKTSPLHTVNDVMLLLESICGLSKRSSLVCRLLLPQCRIVSTLVEEARTQVIRDFLLHARLPPFLEPTKHGLPYGDTAQYEHKYRHTGLSEADLVQPRSLERRISSFLLRFLESLIVEWESLKDTNGHPPAEGARESLDMAVTALCFESALVLNGTRNNRHVIQAACKIITSVMARLVDARWTNTEKAHVLLGLEPLWLLTEEQWERRRWEAMLPPDIGTGIKSQVFRSLTSHRLSSQPWQALRSQFLRTIWKSNDVQDTFSGITDVIKDTFRVLLGEPPQRSSHTADVDDKDGFGPIRTSTMQQLPVSGQHSEEPISIRCIAEICVSYLVVVPILQSTSGEPTRDRELTELVLSCAETRPEKFLTICPVFLSQVRQETLTLSVNNLDRFLDSFETLLKQYNYAKSEKLQLMVIQLLDSTLHIWLSDMVATTDIGGKIRLLGEWLSTAARKKKFASWQVRDSFICFLDRYMARDPYQRVWSTPEEDESAEDTEQTENLPIRLLPMMGADEDIHVRFRAAVVNARLFIVARTIQGSPLLLYNQVRDWLTVDLTDYERMLTRLLTLGNIMVVSSAVRRGPYWHLLETCLHSNLYSQHIESILTGVAQRMGLSNLAVLFEAYASQLAYSIRQGGYDFLRFPPHLLGYQDRKGCAEATFKAFTPTNMLAGGPSQEAIEHGQRLFEGHCKVVQKSVDEGIRDCFGDIIGYQVVACLDDTPVPSSEQMETLLKQKSNKLKDSKGFEELLRQHADAIVVSILHTLGDQDFGPGGSISRALRSVDSDTSAQVFASMVRFRSYDDFALHEPNLPVYSAASVLRALSWFHTRMPESRSKATTYHVLHELFADIHRSPLVNEQLRLITAVSLWAAFHADHFEDSTLLHILVHGAASLLAQTDLARAGQSILDWAFDMIRKISIQDTHLSDLLIRICHQAHDYSQVITSELERKMGTELLTWVNKQASRFTKIDVYKDSVRRALPAWSHQLSRDLAEIYQELRSQDLSSVLGDCRITSNKFRLVRRLRDLALQGDYDHVQFSKADFWRLMKCIPALDELQDEDVDAFSILLVLYRGQLDSFGRETSGSLDARARHRHGLRQPRDDGGEGASPQEAILFALLMMLNDNTPSRIQMAYEALRLLVSASYEQGRPLQVWPSGFSQDLVYLQEFSRTLRKASQRELKELRLETFRDAATNFPRWIAMITSLLSDIISSKDPFYAQLVPILQSDVGFAEQVLPILVHTLLQVNYGHSSASTNRTLLSEYLTSVLRLTNVDHRCLSAIVDVVLHLRHFLTKSKDALAYDKWLDLDYVLLAQSAITCGAYTTALLFLQLSSEYHQKPTPDDFTVEQILYDIYNHIDEPDGFYGIKTNDLHQFLLRRFHHEQQWDKAFKFHGAALEAASTSQDSADGLLYSFHSFGFNHLAMNVLQSSSVASASPSDSSTMSYQLGWRTETWDLPEKADAPNGASSLYIALRAVHRERDPLYVEKVVRGALYGEIQRLQMLGAENLAEIHQVVQNLMCLGQVIQWREPSVQRRLQSKQIDNDVWMPFVQIESDFEFSDLETIMSTRVSLIRSLRQKEQREQIGNMNTPFTQALIGLEKRCLLRLSEAARQTNQGQVALNAIIRAQQLEDSPTFAVSQEFASVLWVHKEEKLAVQSLKGLLDQMNAGKTGGHTVDVRENALLLARLGSWTSEACLAKPTDILSHFFTPAASLIQNLDTSTLDPSYAAVFHQSAVFADRQYRVILKSPDAERWKLYMNLKQSEMEARSREINALGLDPDKRKRLVSDQDKARKLYDSDKHLFQEHHKTRDAFLVQAIDMYSRCLETSGAFDDDGAIHLCSLWFANFDERDLQPMIEKALKRIPSRKFIFLAHQLTARLSKTNTGSMPAHQVNLHNLVLRMCEDHPFHCLYQVYCIKQQKPPPEPSSTRRHSSRQNIVENPISTQTDRGIAAQEIFDRLRVDPARGERVRSIERLCDAALQWAMYPVKVLKKIVNYRYHHPFNIPNGMAIRDITHLKIPVMTAWTPIDPTLQYMDCVWVESFDQTFTTSGGGNLPRICICRGSDGKAYKQLVRSGLAYPEHSPHVILQFKGNDDLRQDAVMEQVFDLVNIVLRKDRETQKRSLSIRRYKIIPIAPQAGVLEFVNNTMPLADWVRPAHKRYRPTDMTYDEVVMKLRETRERRPETVLDVWKQILPKFKPVMRHYFTERHKTPIAWFAMRLRYTRSTATNSIVGHVLGLGDRHFSNILIDKETGEVIHIDLGIAFEQGKLLPIPERVPFRMTRDVVDGMGITGTQGVFQRCAEETLRVLRDGSEVIMTVLEVFKHDPLHSWTASEVKLQRVQGSDAGTTGVAQDTARFLGIGINAASGTALESADRALTSVAHKLDKALSVEYTVNQLLAEATDETNLGSMFQGWGPHA